MISTVPEAPVGRGIYCNRTLNMRGIQVIGYDMDYTLVHYREREWEARAYAYTREALVAAGLPAAGLEFDPDFAIRGLIVDLDEGNLVKADRFGYVKRAAHGTRMLAFDEQRAVYARAVVDLREPRWSFFDTLFSLSEGCLYAQLVDLLDAGELPGVTDYRDLSRRLRAALDLAHCEGRLKAEITADPDRFIDLDAEAPRALLDQKAAGKKLLLITNSEWAYTRAMMEFAYDPYLPGSSWRSLFDIVVVGARKPRFFEGGQRLLRVVDDSGLLLPADEMELGGTYLGGDADAVEACLGLDGSEVLYVGDHVWSDVHVSKASRRWRTALVLRELEEELLAIAGFAAEQRELETLMAEKVALEGRQARARLALERGGEHPATLRAALASSRTQSESLDQRIAPLARAYGELVNGRWGMPLRAGNDKSHLARQIERHADVYTSRVSNFLFATPFAYLRPGRSSMPHDPGR